MKILDHLAYAVMGRVERMSTRHRERLLRARLGRVGHGCTIRGSMRVSGAEHVWIGDNVHIGEGAWIRGEGGLTIGDHTHISRNVVIYTVNHDYEGERLPYDEKLTAKPVVIGHSVWIGMNVCIAPGTRIGDGAIIGIGTTVFGEVPPLAIVGSSPWRVLRKRDADRFEERAAARMFGGPDGVPYEPPN